MKGISVATATAVGLGAIIGAGIFVLSGTAIALAGSYAIFAFLLVGIVAYIVALEFGELGTIMPDARGAAYSYTYSAFGSELGFIIGILLFFSYATAISAISLGFGSYLSSLLGISSTGFQLYSRLFALALILVLSVVNMLGIRKAARSDFALVLIKIGILALFVIAVMFIAFHSGRFSLGNFATSSAKGSLGAIFAASVVIFFAYTGFQTISTFGSRIEGAARGAAKAIRAAVIISIALYLLVVIAMIVAVPASNYKVSADPLSFALSSIMAPNWLFIIVGIGALVATTSATLAMVLSSSRILYQIGKDKLLPKFVAERNSKRDVAVNGTIISAMLGAVMLFSGNIYIIASLSNFGLLLSYLMTSFAVIHFRRKKISGTAKTPFYPYLPVIAIIMLLAFLLGMPKETLLIGVMLLLSLIIVYYFLREFTDKRVVRVKLFK